MSNNFIFFAALAGGAYYYYRNMNNEPGPPVYAEDIKDYNDRVRAENMGIETARLRELQGRVAARVADVALMREVRAKREADRLPALERTRLAADAYDVAHPLNLRMELIGGVNRIDNPMFATM